MLFGAQANYPSGSGCFNGRHPFGTMDAGIVQHPPTKRTLDMRHAEGAPRAKRRFEKVAARFGNFSISRDEQPNMGHSMESSSDDDELVAEPVQWENPIPHEAEVSTRVVVEEPEDESTSKRLRLADELSEYLEKAKDHPIIWKKLMEESRVGEGALIVWRPPVPLPNPLDDPSMKGRINEMSDEEDEFDTDGDLVLDDEIAHVGEESPEVSYPDEYRESSSSIDSIPSTISSTPLSSPLPDESGYGNRIVEINDGGTSTDSSLEDEAMEMD